VNDDYFDRLGAELAELTRQGVHLESHQVRARRRVMVARRAVAVIALGVTLAVSLIGEFPASASGHVRPAPQAAAIKG
jgi:hypothetical protein